MGIAELIPTMDDAALASLRLNATRLTQAGGPKQAQAVELLPLIEAELAARQALKPPPKSKARKTPVKAAAAKPAEKPPAKTASAKPAAKTPAKKASAKAAKVQAEA